MAKALKKPLQKIDNVSVEINKVQKASESTKLIAIDLIDFNPKNKYGKNDTKKSVEELAFDIMEKGLLHNIVVYEHSANSDTGETRYMLISGERRVKAYKHLQKPAIKANIIPAPTNVIDEFKLIIAANEEVRPYSIEEKMEIISEFKKDIDLLQANGEIDEDAGKMLKNYIVKTFNVESRQADRLIKVNNELSEGLTQKLFENKIDLSTAAEVSALPEDYQEYALNIFETCDKDDSESTKYAKDLVLDFCRKSKTAISKNKAELTKKNTAKQYRVKCLERFNSELSDCEAIIANSNDGNSAECILATSKIEGLKAKISEAESIKNRIEDEIEELQKKTTSDVKVIFDDAVFKAEKGPSKTTIDKSGEIAQDKKIQKEMDKIARSADKLRLMFPGDEIGEIIDLLQAYAKRYEKERKTSI